MSAAGVPRVGNGRVRRASAQGGRFRARSSNPTPCPRSRNSPTASPGRSTGSATWPCWWDMPKSGKRSWRAISSPSSGNWWRSGITGFPRWRIPSEECSARRSHREPKNGQAWRARRHGNVLRTSWDLPPSCASDGPITFTQEPLQHAPNSIQGEGSSVMPNCPP